MSENTGSPNQRSKMGPVEKSMLEYVLSSHMRHMNRRASILSLLLHSHLLARGARPVSSVTAILDNETFKGDPIRLSYTLAPRPKHDSFSSVICQLQLSVAETDAQIFVNLTDTNTDKFGHLELSGVEHIGLASASADPHPLSSVPAIDLTATFPLLDNLLDMIEKHVISPVLPSPPLNRSTDSKREKPFATDRPGEPHLPPSSVWPDPDPYNYGRSDLDPLAGVGGGMLMDPRRPPAGIRPIMGGPNLLPPGSVPPGARFDPFGPGVLPNQPRRGPRNPDPDSASPPGFDDVYL